MPKIWGALVKLSQIDLANFYGTVTEDFVHIDRLAWLSSIHHLRFQKLKFLKEIS